MAGTSRLSDVARHIVQPAGIVDSDWWDVEASCSALGLRFDRWQDGLGALVLATGEDGNYAADTAVISIPRQVGKTYLIGCIAFAMCIRQPGTTVIWTAHRFKTARESFTAMKALARKAVIAPEVERIANANGEEGIHFANGSRVLFGARENGFGLGFATVGVLVLDEAQRLTSKAMDDLIPTTNAHPNPLILLTGTPPRPTDPGDVFRQLRDDALSGESQGTLFVEISADQDAALDDRDQWRKANPSYPHRTGERAILRMLKNLSPDSFRREALGIWDERAHKPVVTRPAWNDMTAHGLLPDIPAAALGVDAGKDGVLYLAGCWMDGDEPHIELLPLPTDLNAAAELVAARAGRRIPIVGHTSSPAKALLQLLAARKANVKVTSGPDMATATGLFIDDIKAGRLTHAGQKQLTDGLQTARTKPYGDAGSVVWDFTSDGVPPVIAATLARFGASTKRPRTSGERAPRKGREAVLL